MNVLIEKKLADKFEHIKVLSLVIKFDKNEIIQKHTINPIEFKDPISSIPVISDWRNIYREMGIKPTKFYSSIESLLKRYKNDNWKTEIPFVDLYNSFSIQYMAPMGAYDLDKLNSLTLRYGRYDDSFSALSSISNYDISENIIVYAQGNDVACWGINHRDSKLFSITEYSRNILIVSEGFNMNQSQFAENAIQAFRKWCIENGISISDIYSSEII